VEWRGRIKRPTQLIDNPLPNIKVIGEVFMATTLAQAQNSGNTDDLIGYEDAINRLSREERFRATVYAMNTLLVQKGIYSPEEFEFQFRQFAQKNLKTRWCFSPLMTFHLGM
jgi:hypothetical protein